MPVSRKHAKSADLRSEAATRMGIDLQYVFFLPKSRSKPVLAIWTEGWSEDEIQRVRAMKSEIKAMAAAVGAKIYMTPVHPHEQELREIARRKSRGQKHRQRQSVKRQAK
jgi:3-deoxy-D-arabino-heptulosonate 7-phosphate (DAHP) synthase